MRDVSAIANGVAPIEVLRVRTGDNTDSAFLNSQELARARVVSRAFQTAAGLQGDFVKLDILFKRQGRERADTDVLVGTKMIGVILAADHGHIRRSLWSFQELANLHAE